MPSVHVHISAYPLGYSEPSKLTQAIRQRFKGCAWVKSREYGGAWFTELTMELETDSQFDQKDLSERLSITIWAAVGRYVKVAVDISDGDTDLMLQRILVVSDYRKLMRIL